MDIQINSLSFKYNHLPVLEDLSFDIDAGSLVGIIGPNGAGKTTFLKLIERILKPKRGVITIGDEKLEEIKHSDLAKMIGYIPQSQTSPFPTSVFNTILMGRKPYFSWGPTEEDINIVSSIIADLGLNELSLRNINEMSGGQRQKAIFGRALAQNPDILLLDEPTANLDLKHQLEILDLLRDLSESGKTVIMAIHDINLALKYCDKFIIIHKNKLFAYGGKEIFTEERIEEVFGVKASIIEREDRLFIIPESCIKEHT